MKQPIRRGLYGILWKRLEKLQKDCKKDIIPFPEIFGKLCGNFSIKKEDCWEILFLLRDLGLIEIVPYHGIKIC